MEATMVFSLGLLVLLDREWGIGWRIIIGAYLGTSRSLMSVRKFGIPNFVF